MEGSGQGRASLAKPQSPAKRPTLTWPTLNFPNMLPHYLHDYNHPSSNAHFTARSQRHSLFSDLLGRRNHDTGNAGFALWALGAFAWPPNALVCFTLGYPTTACKFTSFTSSTIRGGHKYAPYLMADRRVTFEYVCYITLRNWIKFRTVSDEMRLRF